MRRAQTSSGKLKRKFYYQFLSLSPAESRSVFESLKQQK